MSQTEVQLIKSSSVEDGDIVGLSSSKLSGALPAISGASLTNLDAGKVLQVQHTVKKDIFSETLTPGTTSSDITGLTVSITPSNANNKILLQAHVNGGPNNSTGLFAFFYKNGSLMTDAIGDAGNNSGGTARRRISFGSQGGTLLDWEDMHGSYLDTAGGTSAITYSIRIQTAFYASSGDAGTIVYVNRAGKLDENYNNSFNFPSTISTFTAMEVAA